MDDRRKLNHSPGDAEGRHYRPRAWISVVGESSRRSEDDSAALPGGEIAPHVRIVCGAFWGKRGPVEGIAADDPIYLDVSVAPRRRKKLPVETTRQAFAYVFGGGGKFCNASGPLAVPTEGVKWLDTAPPTEADDRSLVLFNNGDELEVEVGRKRRPFPALLRQTAPGASRMVRTDCDEYATGAASSL